MDILKTFGVWFAIGRGLLLSGFICIESIRDYSTDRSANVVPYLIGTFVVAGGIFVALVAVALSRVAQRPIQSLGGLRRGQELLEYASRLGISLKHVYDSNGNLQEPELQSRVLEAEKTFLQQRQAAIAVGAAVFAAFSAVAAWITHFK